MPQRRKDVVVQIINDPRPYALIPAGEALAKIDLDDLTRCLEWTWRLHKKNGGRLYAFADRGDTIRVTMHGLVAGAAPPGMVIDHINGDTLDNRRANLRHVTQSGNAHNVVMGKRTGRSGYRGVSWHTQAQRWAAAIKVRGAQAFLGLYDDAEEAARVFDDAARRLVSGVATVNFPRPGERSARTGEVQQ